MIWKVFAAPAVSGAMRLLILSFFINLDQVLLFSLAKVSRISAFLCLDNFAASFPLSHGDHNSSIFFKALLRLGVKPGV